MTESRIQSSIMRFLDLALPGSYRAFAVPNGGRRDKITGAILKREGVKAGVPDIIVVRDGGSVAFIEVKTAKGRLSNSQTEFRDWCGLNSVPFGVVRNVSDVESFLIDLNVPLKARAAA
jgi:hypothetical protein